LLDVVPEIEGLRAPKPDFDFLDFDVTRGHVTEPKSGKGRDGAGSRIQPTDVGFDPFRSALDGSPIGDGAPRRDPISVSIEVDPSKR